MTKKAKPSSVLDSIQVEILKSITSKHVNLRDPNFKNMFYLQILNGNKSTLLQTQHMYKTGV
jgi:hypothetical protein